VIGEAQFRRRFHQRHVTAGTGTVGNRSGVLWRWVAFGALGVSSGFRVLMRVMAADARQFPLAFQEAGALAEVYGLVANVPGVVEIGGDALCRRHAMALAAKAVQSSCGQAFGIRDVIAAGLGRVVCSGAVAGFAADTRLSGHNRP